MLKTYERKTKELETNSEVCKKTGINERKQTYEMNVYNIKSNL